MNDAGKSFCVFVLIVCLSVGAWWLTIETMPPSPKPAIHINLKFEKGQMVDLKIGGQGQIVVVEGGYDSPYRVRVWTNDGPQYFWFSENELVIK
jgi:uncharacterized protein YodC (DUF2158 family)